MARPGTRPFSSTAIVEDSPRPGRPPPPAAPSLRAPLPQGLASLTVVERSSAHGGMGAVVPASRPPSRPAASRSSSPLQRSPAGRALLREARPSAGRAPQHRQVHEVARSRAGPTSPCSTSRGGASRSGAASCPTRPRSASCATWRAPVHNHRPQDRPDPPRPEAREHPHRQGRPRAASTLGGGLRPGQEQGEEVLTRTGLINGTPAYVFPSPRAGSGRAARPPARTSTALGVGLYELLTESPPSSDERGRHPGAGAQEEPESLCASASPASRPTWRRSSSSAWRQDPGGARLGRARPRTSTLAGGRSDPGPSRQPALPGGQAAAQAPDPRRRGRGCPGLLGSSRRDPPHPLKARERAE